MDFELMTGYDFEEYIANFFKSKGFDVQQTSYSHDGGIDLIAICNEPIFCGKYIIQCKKYTDTLVGQPVIRDLYGVVMSENANKGILITTSDFTEGAQSFAKNKNLELINGKILAEIVSTDSVITRKDEAVEGFNHERYRYLMEKIDENPSDPHTYNDVIKFLRTYVIEDAPFIEQLQLFDKIIDLNKQLIKKCYKKKSEAIYKKVSWLKIAEMEMLKGNIGEAINILLDENKFYITTWVPNYFKYIRCAGPERTDYTDYYEIHPWNIEARNLYSVLKKLGFIQVCDLILSKYSLDNELAKKRDIIVAWFKEHSSSEESQDLIHTAIINTFKEFFCDFISPQSDNQYIFSSPYVDDPSSYERRWGISPIIKYPSEEKIACENINVIVKRYKKTREQMQYEIELALKQHGINL